MNVSINAIGTTRTTHSVGEFAKNSVRFCVRITAKRFETLVLWQVPSQTNVLSGLNVGLCLTAAVLNVYKVTERPHYSCWKKLHQLPNY